jgi:outer membrane receptor protein involved in Fe transport
MHRASTLLQIAALALVVAPALAAQGTPAPRSPNAIGEIRGRLVETGTNRPITGGSITVRRADRDSAFAGGALPKPDGTFRVDGLTAGRYVVRVRALGFAPLVKSDVVIGTAQPIVELGDLVLKGTVTTLEGQTVVAERDEVALAPDRNSYSTKNMATASGGTAIDVLRNVPSVEVDGTNNVSLRGNQNVVVQINGRSSPLKGEQLGNFLAQLPASTVARVEVSTNPSAKNDPEGTAGILNIVLNQEAEIGLSGGITAGTSTTGTTNLSGNVGQQRGPLTVLLSASLYRDNRVLSGEATRTNLVASAPPFVDSWTLGTMQPLSRGATLRSEYRLNGRDALTFDGFLYSGRYVNSSRSHSTDLGESREMIGEFDQYNSQVAHSLSQDYTIAFRRLTKPTAPSLSIELRYSTNSNATDADLYGVLQQADQSIGATELRHERDRTTGGFPSWNLQADYTRPFGTGTKLETGFKGTSRGNSDSFTAAYLDSASGSYVPAAERARAFDYRERIGAGYVVLSQQVGKLQAQGGLRLEEASTHLVLPATSITSDNRYGSAFPSAIVSYNFTAMRQAKVSYSRRISRPNPFQLTPIEYRQDARSVFRGNPSLRPEYTDALELGLQEARNWGSIQLNPYLRKTAHAVRYIQTVDTSGVSVSTFDNVASTTTVGTDLNVSYHRGPITLFGGGSAYRYSSDASNLAGDLSTKATVWSLRANATWKATPLTDVQAFANYRGPYATEGGSQSAFAMVQFALRYKLWGDKGNISVRVSDPFNMMNFGYRTANGQVIEVSERRFGMRGIFLTVTKNFGQQLKLRPKAPDTEVQGPPTPAAGAGGP